MASVKYVQVPLHVILQDLADSSANLSPDDNIKYHQWVCAQVKAWRELERQSKYNMAPATSNTTSGSNSAQAALSGTTAVSSQPSGSNAKTRSSVRGERYIRKDEKGRLAYVRTRKSVTPTRQVKGSDDSKSKTRTPSFWGLCVRATISPKLQEQKLREQKLEAKAARATQLPLQPLTRVRLEAPIGNDHIKRNIPHESSEKTLKSSHNSLSKVKSAEAASVGRPAGEATKATKPIETKGPVRQITQVVKEEKFPGVVPSNRNADEARKFVCPTAGQTTAKAEPIVKQAEPGKRTPSPPKTETKANNISTQRRECSSGPQRSSGALVDATAVIRESRSAEPQVRRGRQTSQENDHKERRKAQSAQLTERNLHRHNRSSSTSSTESHGHIRQTYSIIADSGSRISKMVPPDFSYYSDSDTYSVDYVDDNDLPAPMDIVYRLEDPGGNSRITAQMQALSTYDAFVHWRENRGRGRRPYETEILRNRHSAAWTPVSEPSEVCSIGSSSLAPENSARRLRRACDR